MAETYNDPTHRNSFDAIRVFAAVAVFLSHQVGMAGLVEPALGPLGITLSSTGLYIFFALSGYLVFRSLAADPRPKRFFVSRILRVFPGSIVNTFFCVLLGVIVTTQSTIEFLTNQQTWRYLLHNLPIITAPTQFNLPGVFEDVRWRAVNGSIWTLKYELLCYAALFVTFHTLNRLRVPIAFGIGALTALLVGLYIHHISTEPNPVGEAFFGPYNSFNVIRFSMTFMAAAWCASCEPLRERQRLLALVVPAGLILLGPTTECARAGIILLLVLTVIELGKSPSLFSEHLRGLGDLSYGLYLYAYPVQNLFARMFNGHNFWLVTSLSFGCIVGLATLSWRFVERPALSLKPKPRLVTISAAQVD